LAVLVTFKNPALQNILTWALLAFMAVYVLLGPFYVLARYGPARERELESEAAA
jgi:cytochrome oxidase assembly protein ShyY1